MVIGSKKDDGITRSTERMSQFVIRFSFEPYCMKLDIMSIGCKALFSQVLIPLVMLKMLVLIRRLTLSPRKIKKPFAHRYAQTLADHMRQAGQIPFPPQPISEALQAKGVRTRLV